MNHLHFIDYFIILIVLGITLWLGFRFITCILFTAYAFLTSTPIGLRNPKLLLDPGSFNFTHHKLMLGVYSHIVVIVVGFVASLFFPKPVLQENLLFTSWKKNRKYENV